jgi:uncharacterized protein with HEPN domain
MRLEVKKHLEDIRHAASLLERFSVGKDVDDYLEDPMLSSAIERQFEIIGEALNRLLKTEPALEARITDARRVIDFRNILIHGYDAVDEKVVWDILVRKLPVLRREVERLLEDPSP